MKRYCLCLDLKDDPVLIAEYVAWHKKVWPEVIESIKNAGIHNMEIYRLHNRLFMIIDAADNFDFAEKAKSDAENAIVEEWEKLMWNLQQPLPWSKPGEKWMLMDKIFDLEKVIND